MKNLNDDLTWNISYPHSTPKLNSKSNFQMKCLFVALENWIWSYTLRWARCLQKPHCLICWAHWFFQREDKHRKILAPELLPLWKWDERSDFLPNSFCQLYCTNRHCWHYQTFWIFHLKVVCTRGRNPSETRKSGKSVTTKYHYIMKTMDVLWSSYHEFEQFNFYVHRYIEKIICYIALDHFNFWTIWRYNFHCLKGNVVRWAQI